MSKRYVHYLHADEKAEVKWYNKERGMMGIELLHIKEPKGYKVVREDEVDFRYGEIEADPEKKIDKDIKKEKYEDLRSRIKKLRKERQDLGKKKSRQTRSKKKTPKQTLSNMSEEEKEKIRQMLQGD